MSEKQRRRPPAKSLDARENQLILAAVDLAEKMIRDGTASSQVITHFLKLGSTRERAEKAKLEKEIDLIEAKAESYKSVKRVEELYKNALDAMRRYSGQRDLDDD